MMKGECCICGCWGKFMLGLTPPSWKLVCSGIIKVTRGRELRAFSIDDMFWASILPAIGKILGWRIIELNKSAGHNVYCAKICESMCSRGVIFGCFSSTFHRIFFFFVVFFHLIFTRFFFALWQFFVFCPTFNTFVTNFDLVSRLMNFSMKFPWLRWWIIFFYKISLINKKVNTR